MTFLVPPTSPATGPLHMMFPLSEPWPCCLSLPHRLSCQLVPVALVNRRYWKKMDEQERRLHISLLTSVSASLARVASSTTWLLPAVSTHIVASIFLPRPFSPRSANSSLCHLPPTEAPSLVCSLYTLISVRSLFTKGSSSVVNSVSCRDLGCCKVPQGKRDWSRLYPGAP